MELKIEYVPLSEIQPYKRNAKLHPEEQIEQICNSIRKTGFNDPIGIWNGEIVEGHGRYLAAKKLKMKEVPIIRLDELTDEQRRAYMLAHNKLTMNSGFDLQLLDSELAEIGTIDMTLLGFEEPQEPKETDRKEVEINDEYCITIECETEEELEETFEKLQSEGYKCKNSTL